MKKKGENMKFVLFLFSDLLIACSNPTLAQGNSVCTSSSSTLMNFLATSISSLISINYNINPHPIALALGSFHVSYRPLLK